MTTQKYKPIHSTLGRHAIVEFSGCSRLDDLSYIRRELKVAANAAGATILNTRFHKFEPQGVTGVVILAESHISIHTWPEYGYAAVDVFLCGGHDPNVAIESIKKSLGAADAKVMTVERGL